MDPLTRSPEISSADPVTQLVRALMKAAAHHRETHAEDDPLDTHCTDGELEYQLTLMVRLWSEENTHLFNDTQARFSFLDQLPRRRFTELVGDPNDHHTTSRTNGRFHVRSG